MKGALFMDVNENDPFPLSGLSDDAIPLWDDRAFRRGESRWNVD
jgi:hypothetical protein